MTDKKICILHTGGTIGMTAGERGYVPKAGYLEGMLKSISDLYVAGMPKYDFYEMSPLLDSSDITVKEWNKIAKVISDNYSSYDGFVVLHGTDTMAYTASALQFNIYPQK